MTAFGETATVGGKTIQAIFSFEYAEVNDVESRRPVLTVRTADVSSPVHGIAAVVRGVTYAVKNIQDDGTGMTLLVLGK